MDVSPLPDQIDLLRTLADAYRVPHPTLGKQELIYSRSSAGTHVQHHAMGEIQVDMGDLKELAGHGFIEMTETGNHDGDLWVTSEGYHALEELNRRERIVSTAGQGSGRVLAMDWETEVAPVLAAVYSAWSEVPSEHGVNQDAVNERLGREPGDEATGLILHKLEQEGYIRESLHIEGDVPGPAFFEPIGRTLEMLAGWPASNGEAAYTQLLAELDARIEQAEGTDMNRLVKVREAVVELGKSTAADILANVITGGGGAAGG